MTRAELLGFLRMHRLAVVSTVHDGAPQAAVVGIAVSDELEIIFDTLTTSRKYQNLRADPRAALVIGWDAEQTTQLEGVADFPTGAELAACKQVYFAAWPDGPQREAWPNIGYVRVRPCWVRFSDFGVMPVRVEEIELE
ncbi:MULTISPECIES: pyridoxamine 5'-phosphate oxidase family protein [unclassified Bradyrhizobium]|uniref:pyridoxamine 5'-phosphate oxidase family protein n=1 Tax=unclassified Bradyrhizobium TaxID=2631580 RepID=UPI001BA70216|nr:MULTISPECIES: pyridoxamine 5'-phosphate oxidase family protein [unclassified Bradyrhizobium]MBR1207912.1 pyridoxamine 5'-phosphate oxidase family protein [Bradyrhizobium sp. AUGA SZCCT0124]MBR1314578.1 pyridoxamine 5'-phosphate oxidase family protein [Bradyrhizobium sp. AUGA SZCCT0051]MBR1342402.1 pyridoxamine 5'-phosphate oxidase family protein [Bradyrhizobium sp. AUGA SZCCT0105]MBR1352632.1 pyridoxamine 5'-phosphate oxidase family protein [Bradyrhizobium sp. AUGA SZCCT0045]